MQSDDFVIDHEEHVIPSKETERKQDKRLLLHNLHEI